MTNIILAILLLTIIDVNVPEASASPPTAFEGRRLFVSYCLLCHRVDGKGYGPLAKKMQISPADLTTTVRSRSDTIFKKIITGESRQTITAVTVIIFSAMLCRNGRMYSMFNDSQIDALIAYLRFLGSSKHGLMELPEFGMQIYQKFCQVCHGDEGGGDGIMTKLMKIRPMDHSSPDETNTLDNGELVRSILDGKERFMQAWRSILSQSDVEAPVRYIRLLSY